MRSEEKGNVKNSVGRLVLAALAILVQLFWIIFLAVRLSRYSTVISVISSILALALVLKICGKRINSAFKTLWIIMILTFPVLGISLYLLFGTKNATAGIRRRFFAVHDRLLSGLVRDEAVLDSLYDTDINAYGQFRYLCKNAKYPVYGDTEVTFYADASDGLEAQLEALKSAERFIFMEYHAIEDAAAFERIFEILSEKAASGVEVRLLYDDVGSIGFVNFEFINKMKKSGIICKVFNPVLPVLQIFMNNRDHRKITVVDGKTAFTGGYNLADEYFNITHPYGYWKDTGVRLSGPAADSLTAMFLEMWNCTEKQNGVLDGYTGFAVPCGSDGYVQPYADSPLDSECVGEDVYLNVIKKSVKTLYITTPYLIISDEMNRELVLAAKRGVDVRIITPGIPDKKLIYRVTRSYYGALVQQGVRIYEYTPGFMHAKQMTADGKTAVIGTVNLDYRSLYHHFENGVLMYGCKAVSDMERDFEACLQKSTEVTEKYTHGRFAVLRGLDCVLRLLAPLL